MQTLLSHRYQPDEIYITVPRGGKSIPFAPNPFSRPLHYLMCPGYAPLGTEYAHPAGPVDALRYIPQ